jgi:flagellar basal-body rod modification protein FlgD
MNIDQIFAPAAVTPATGSKKELGQEDFLKLLVAQMKNQDPGNPADNGEFLSQIAQFSMVSGIDDLGTSFKGIASGFHTTQAMQASELVGREVLTDSNSVLLREGKEVSGVIAVPEFTDGLNIQVRDIYGALVKTLDPGDYRSGASNFSWDGTTEAGEVLTDGEYTVSATALVNGTQIALPVQLYNHVESITVDRGTSSVELQLDNHRRIDFSQVSQYR